MKKQIMCFSLAVLTGVSIFSAAAASPEDPAPNSTQQQAVQTQQQGVGQSGNRQQPPPPIRPPQGFQLRGVRQSNKWVKTKSGAMVAVDESVTGDGIRVYNSLTWHLVAVDENDDTKLLWDSNTSAFWDKMAIEQIEVEGEEEKVWALAQRASRYEQFVEYRNLHTGELIRTDGEEPAEGEAVKLSQVISGSAGKQDDPLHELVDSADRWKQIYADVFEGLESPADQLKDIDFSKEALIVYYSGKATNCRGFSVQGAYETDDEFILRVHAYTYQSDGNPPPEHPFGLFVVPRMTEKPYVIQTDRQGLIGGPRIWTEKRRFEPLAN